MQDLVLIHDEKAQRRRGIPPREPGLMLHVLGMGIQISRILHAGYILECKGVKIAFDPIFENPFSYNCYAFPPVSFDENKIRNLNLTAVLISHFHDDHCSLKSLDFLDRETPIYIYCIFEELLDWIRELGFTKVHQLELNKKIQLGPFEVTPLEALDVDVDSLFHVEADGLNILNVVDSWIGPKTFDRLQKVSWDLIMWPFQTMQEIEVISPMEKAFQPPEIPFESLDQLKILKPHFLVPSSCQFIHESWSWYRFFYFPISYKMFSETISKYLPDTQVVRMDPSISYSLTTEKAILPAEPLDWVRLLDSKSVDYTYDPSQPIPGTSEIAQHFPELNPAEWGQVFDFCSMKILERFKNLDRLEESFFEEPRNWRLTTYKSSGEAVHFYYTIQNQDIFLANTDQKIPDWTTELSAYKLYSALERGETLTSLYVRINDSANGDSGVRDPLWDPLIRCLFDGRFGDYQKNQLQSLKSFHSSPR